jgi:hypothetical protein
MRKLLLALAVTPFVLISCEDPKKEQPLDKLSWLEGEWEGMTEQNITREEWTRSNDKLMTGGGYVLAGTDTVFKEHLKLMARDTNIYYIVFIPGRPDSTVFTLTRYANDEAVFENPEHDDPQRVIYKKTGTDSIYAYTESATLQGIKRIEYPFKRISSPPKKEERKK